MDNLDRWIAGGVLGLVSLAGLYAASRSHDSSLYWIGLIVAVACILLIFGLVKRSFDEADARHAASRRNGPGAP